jgi:hypothetical protein
MKTCTSCNHSKLLSEFYRNKRSKDGTTARCKDCLLEAIRKYQADNPDKVKDSRKKSDANCRERVQEEKKRYREKNRESINARAVVAASKPENKKKKRDYRQRTKEHRAQYDKDYAVANPDKVKEKAARRRARKLMVLVEVIDRKTVFERDNGICYLCSQPVNPDNWHLDHIHPISKGGTESYDNVAVTHPSCNLSKGDKLL